MGAFELATMLLVAAFALAAAGLALFVGALGLLVLFRSRSAPIAHIPGKGAPVLRPVRNSVPPRGPPVPPISVSQGKKASYFDDDTGEPNTATTKMTGGARLRSAGDGDHDEHTELFSMAEVEAELAAGGVMEDVSTPGTRIPPIGKR